MSAAAPVSRRIALDTGLTYHVLEWGGDEPALDHTVLLLHGFLDIAWGWEPTVRAGLAGRYHVIAPELRGHGDSDRVGAGGYYHFLDYLADVHALAGALGRRRLSIVGHSMGGTVAGYYAGAYPERVDKLALLEGLGPPEGPQAVPERVVAWLASWQRARAQVPRAYADVGAAAAQLRRHDALLTEALALELAERGTTLGADGQRRFKHDPLHLTMGPYPFRLDVAETFWRRVRSPVLLVEGAESVFRQLPIEAERRAACFAESRRAVLTGAAHMMHRHQPAALAELLVDFLGG